jgi:hypothetical protein
MELIVVAARSSSVGPPIFRPGRRFFLGNAEPVEVDISQPVDREVAGDDDGQLSAICPLGDGGALGGTGPLLGHRTLLGASRWDEGSIVLAVADGGKPRRFGEPLNRHQARPDDIIREYDREAVRAIPEILAEAGLEIQRSGLRPTESVPA